MDNEIQAQGAWYGDQKPDFQEDPPKPTSPKEFKKIRAICDIFLNLVLFGAGVYVGILFGERNIQKQAVEKNHATWEQNNDTINFKWK